MRETILVVAEETQIRAYLEQILAGAGYAVLGATGPEDALTKSKAFEGPIDLLVSGLWLPSMTGIELRRALAASRPDLRALYCSFVRPAALIELVRNALSEAA